MGDVPESSVSLHELSVLREQWPPAVFCHMVWLQQDLEVMRVDAKKRFWQTKPSPCVYCGTVIKCDMYRHVAMFHLDLAQLWRCPVSWCTVWKGMPQDCMDHVRGAHDVPWIVNTANMEQFVPPWTVHLQVWSDSLKVGHSGISTDIMLSLVHHYRVHKRGLPHIAFRKDYLSKLRALLPVPMAVELMDESPRRMRRAHRQTRPVRVMSGSVSNLPILTLQDAADVQGALVYDCGPPLLPVSLQLCDLGTLAVRRPEVSASVAVPPWEEGQSIDR